MAWIEKTMEKILVKLIYQGCLSSVMGSTILDTLV